MPFGSTGKWRLPAFDHALLARRISSKRRALARAYSAYDNPGMDGTSCPYFGVF